MAHRLRLVALAIPLWMAGTAAACSESSQPSGDAPLPDADVPEVFFPDAPSAVDAGSEAEGGSECSDAGPQDLACTGLYANLATKTVAADVSAYDPGFHLWSDGAEKSRWIRLPPGTKIDTSNMDEWKFPVGTKLWKEFAFGGHRVETRLIEKVDESRHWRRTTFRWSADEKSATELTVGEAHVDGGTYEIPSVAQCNICHSGRVDGVLGFEAIGLSSPAATGLTMSELVARGLVTDAPTAAIVVPGDAGTVAALGYLHANCGTPCHSESTYANAGWTGLFMRLNTTDLATIQTTATYKTAVNRVSYFQVPSDAGLTYRALPQKPERSAIIIRASTRDDALKVQMPPLVSHQVDDAGVQTLTNWIMGL